MSDFDAYTRHVNPVLGGFLKLTGRDLRLVRAEGGALEDVEGRRYDDWVAGFGSFNLGHSPEPVVRAIRVHLESGAPNLYVENLNPFAGALAKALCAASGLDTAFFCNSGAEAVEAALKAAILATGRKRVVHAEGAYHGTTLGALACMGKGLYRRDFDGVLAESPEVPFGDLSALERALEGAAAFLVEPVQMEAGARVASDAYLRGARELCRRAGALFILDEVQTGMGRTGALFAFQHAGATPDILCLAKSLGGGMVPIGAAVMGAGIWTRAYGGYLRCEVHNSTFGGNALACRAALAALEALSRPEFLAEVRAKAAELFGGLERALAGCRLVERLSWRGLLGGIKLQDVANPWLKWENLGLKELAGYPISGAMLTERLARRGILAQVCAHDWSVVRVEPPLTVSRDACARFVDAVGESVRWLQEKE